jgi:ORF6N domain
MHRGSWKSARIPMAYAGILDLSKPREPSNHAQMAYVGAAQLDLERVTSPILIIRGRRVILDRELASLYGVSTSRLNEAVKRNLDRFPDDFMFQLAREEHESLMSHIATSKVGRGGHRKLPRAFTEHGAIHAKRPQQQACCPDGSSCSPRLRAAARTPGNPCVPFRTTGRIGAEVSTARQDDRRNVDHHPAAFTFARNQAPWDWSYGRRQMKTDFGWYRQAKSPTAPRG